jgi:hypothetical protein
MSKTYRQGKHSNKKRDGIKNNDFWYEHDSKEDRDGLNNSFREEEKQHFKKFGDKKYNQKPKSKGWKTH